MRINKKYKQYIIIAALGLIAAGCNSSSSSNKTTDPKTTPSGLNTRSAISVKDDQVVKDLTNRSDNIHWPAGFSPITADLYAHNEITIKASCAEVFRHIQEAEKWPKWYSNSQNVRILNSPSGLLKKGTEFEWDTFGVHIHSHVNEFVQDSRLGWFGNGKDMHAYHTWLLTPSSDGGTKIIMEECVNGKGAVALRKSDAAAMHRGHDLWDNTLKQLAEKQ